MVLNEFFYQHYWWLLISILGALLVFLLFVQGGQTLLLTMAKTPAEKTMLVNSLGRKWEFTFTTLVVFGGAFFASFPLFYSTSFGGAYWLWMAILFSFVLQAVSYEYRAKKGNLLGTKVYDIFLLLNGIVGVILLGVAVGTFFTGADFRVDKANLYGDIAMPVISTWQNPWHGLEAVADWRNLLLGVTIFFLARMQASLYFINNIDDDTLCARAHKQLLYNAVPFVVLFLLFVGTTLCADGFQLDGNGVGGCAVRHRRGGRALCRRADAAVARMDARHLVQRHRHRAGGALRLLHRGLQRHALLPVGSRYAKFADDIQQFVEPLHARSDEPRIAAYSVRARLHFLCVEGYGPQVHHAAGNGRKRPPLLTIPYYTAALQSRGCRAAVCFRQRATAPAASARTAIPSKDLKKDTATLSPPLSIFTKLMCLE